MFQQISIGLLIHIVLVLLTLPRILAIKRDPQKAIAWLWAVNLTPIFGAIAFWTLGDPEIRGPLKRVLKGPPIHISSKRDAEPVANRQGAWRLRRMMMKMGETPSTLGNKCEFFTKGGPMFRKMLSELESAKHEILFQYYILRDDALGERFAQILLRKASEGVAVYVLYDAIGSKSLKIKFLNRLARGGIQLRPFLPFSFLRRRVQINFRNHRKLVVIDRKIAYTGGMNLGMEYTSESKKTGHWFDGHLRVEGPASLQLHEEFAADWAFTEAPCGELMREQPWTPQFKCSEELELDEGWVQTISSGPDQDINRSQAMAFHLINRSREKLWIATPYLVPNPSIISALLNAALGGVDVRILVQSNEADFMLAQWASRYFWEELMDAGVRIYQYTPGMMHAKMFLVDDICAVVGSANMDVRSLALNFELNCAFYSTKEIAAVEELLSPAFDRAEEVGEAFRARKWPIRVWENFCRLLTPVL